MHTYFRRSTSDPQKGRKPRMSSTPYPNHPQSPPPDMSMVIHARIRIRSYSTIFRHTLGLTMVRVDLKNKESTQLNSTQLNSSSFSTHALTLVVSGRERHEMMERLLKTALLKSKGLSCSPRPLGDM